MPRKKKVSLPAAGDVFAVPLEDGRYSVCRVISDRTTNPRLSIHAVLVASSPWIGPTVPELDEELHRPILIRTHHCDESESTGSWIRTPEPASGWMKSSSGMKKLEVAVGWTPMPEPAICWIETPVPDTFVPIGTITPTDEEGTLNWPSHSDWFYMMQQPLMQWRWDHERDAVLAEDATKRQAEAQQDQAKADERRDWLDSVTLEQLGSRVFFSNWRYPTKEATEASRKIMAETVRALMTLGTSASEQDRMLLLQRCIESFNELDQELEFIETVEREDICREFEAIVHACGLGSHEFIADQWRDW